MVDQIRVPPPPSMLRRAWRRVSDHRGEAAVVSGFLVSVTATVAMSGMTPVVARLAAAGLTGAVLAAFATVWIPIAIIDFRRCTRETSLRHRVEADLEEHRRAERIRTAEEDTIRERVEDVLLAGGPQLVYQPIVDMVADRIIGYEALSRFPDGGQPDRWFADAARVGLGVELELAAVAGALEGLTLAAGAYVSVNVSPDALTDPRLLELVTGCSSVPVVVELTEHVVLDDYRQFRSVIADLRRAGARLAVDDAGSGYSGLRHIVDLGPDLIKVDKAIVQRVHSDPSRRSLMVALVSFAQDIGATLVAEGVEESADALALQRWGVRFAQGWLYGRPGPRAAWPVSSSGLPKPGIARPSAALLLPR